MQARIFGIKNCDTMKKARLWLEEHGVEHVFHDYKVSGIDRDHLERWCAEAGWQVVLNRAGTTFKKLPDEAKADLDQEKAIALMLAQPSMIKRPVLEADGNLLVGFKPEIYAAALKA
ncbi:MAG: ArsC family reductase [Rhizobium sp.]|nr:ArsC family reductase [Rhizobium sp.]